MIDIITKYFPNLTDKQIYQFEKLDPLYHEWNEKINIISRKDIDNLYIHHILHSLAIAKFIRFKDNSTILDVGTGGGLPGIPLAIIFPNIHITLIDSIGKKIKVAREITESINLKNVSFKQLRGEEETGKYDFIVSRAVMKLPELIRIINKNIRRTQENALENGIIALKGGNIEGEIKPYKHIAEVTPISSYFQEEWFKEKNIIYVPIKNNKK